MYTIDGSDQIPETTLDHLAGYNGAKPVQVEQIGSSGEALGNLPQAFTHLALISAAVNLDEALNRDLGRR